VRGRPPGDEPSAGTLVTESGNLPLEAIDVRARITSLLAEVALTQTFVNSFDLPLQATYVFPLPDRAAVTEFRMEAGDRVVEGALRERAEARAAYDQAVAGGRLAAIAEEERPGVFTMRVGNLPPGERATVRLAMLGPLPYDQGEATFRFPLVVAPRYVPGAPLGWPPAGDGVQPDTDAVPDASRITPPVLLPGFPNPVRLALEVEIDPGGLRVGEVRSSLHAVMASERKGPGGRVRVVRLQPGERLDRDFVLRLQVGSGGLDTRGGGRLGRGRRARHLRAHGDAAPGGGVAAAGRRAGAGPLGQHGRLEDGGGAARGRPHGGQPVRARPPGGARLRRRRAAAALAGGGRLAPGDRAGRADWPGEGASRQATGAGRADWPGEGASRQATDRERFRAVEFLSRLDARGGTEMAAPLIQALDLLGGAEPGRDRILVLVTDGQVGNEDQVLRLLAPRLEGVRVYAVGIDTAVNEGFLRRLAVAGGGACELVESEDRLDEVLDRVRQRIGTPVVTDLELDAGGLGSSRDR
jgi:Ca-activated chloride channel family protein